MRAAPPPQRPQRRAGSHAGGAPARPRRATRPGVWARSGPPEDLVTSRLPSPAMRVWSMRNALTGARLRTSARDSIGSVSSSASTPSRSSSGSITRTAPRRRGSRIASEPPSTKRTAEPVPGGVVACSLVYTQRIAGRLVVDDDAARHAEVQPEHRARVVTLLARCAGSRPLPLARVEEQLLSRCGVPRDACARQGGASRRGA